MRLSTHGAQEKRRKRRAEGLKDWRIEGLKN